MNVSDYRGMVQPEDLEPILKSCFRMSEGNKDLCRLFFIKGVRIGDMAGKPDKRAVWARLDRVRKKFELNDD